ncbi:hypothetical protein [Ferruginibacter sp.]
MKKIILSCLLAGICIALQAQQTCDKCLQRSITVFDATVKIPAPAGGYSWEYEQLSWPMKFASGYLYNNDPSHNCWFFIDKNFMNGALTTGEVPAPPDNSTPSGKLVSEELDYLVTSTVTGNGEKNTMVMEIQGACDRKTIARSEVTFSWHDDPAALQKAGEQAAAQLMPVSEKIMNYAKEMRETDMRYMLSGSGGQLKIKPKKTKLGIGEETEVEVQAIDCDGYLLKNRRISFKREMLNGFAINGAEGGVITPSVVTTDAQGKAKVKFRLTRTDGNAVIHGHFIGFNPSGCNDVLFGTAYIGIVPVKIELSYMFHDHEEVVANPKLLKQVQTNLNLRGYGYKRHSMELLYYPKLPLKNDFTLTIPAEEDEPSGKAVYLKDEGVYLTREIATGNLASLAMDGSLDMAGDRRRIHSGNADSANHTKIKLDWNFTDMAELQLEFNYVPKGDDFLNDPAKDSYFFRHTPGSKFEMNKVTDKDSPYKWEYLITFDRQDKITDNNTMNTIMSYGGKQSELVKLRILSPYE